MKRSCILLFLILCVAVLLAACGGGGSSKDTAPADGGGGSETPPATASRELFVTGGPADAVFVLDASSRGTVEPLRKWGGNSTLVEPRGVAVDWLNNEIFVADSGNDSITVYARTASGNAEPLRTISGIATGLYNPQRIAVDAVHNEIFVINNSSTITVYARTASGDAAPLRTLRPSTGSFSGIAVDPVNNEIFIAGGNAVNVYMRTAVGDEVPLRTISGDSTCLSSATGVAVDTVNNEILVTNAVQNYNSSVTVYARTASGNVAPRRSISGGYTGLKDPVDIAVDMVSNEILVLNYGIFIGEEGMWGFSVTIYARTASGEARPLTTVYEDFRSPQGIAVDPVNNEFFVSSASSVDIKVFARPGKLVRTISGLSPGYLDNPYGIARDAVNKEIFVTNSDSRSITVFAETAVSMASPLRTISGDSMGMPGGITVDAVNSEIIVADVVNNSIVVYTRTASGNADPLRTISGDATGLHDSHGVAVDTINNEIFVLNHSYPHGFITVYGRTARGNAAPLRTLYIADYASSGSSFWTNGIAVDTLNHEIFLACVIYDGNTGIYQGAIAVYSRTASGNVTPLRTIAGSSTGLRQPVGITVDVVKNEIFVADWDTGSGFINVYARTADGNAAPVRTITAPGLARPSGIALASH